MDAKVIKVIATFASFAIFALKDSRSNSVFGLRYTAFRLVHIHRFRRKYHNIKPLRPSMMPTSHQN